MPNPAMTSSINCFNLVKEFEGCRLAPYLDSAGYASIGVGHLIRKGPITADDLPITEQQAEDLFNQDVQVAVNAVNKMVKVPLSQNEFDALVSWVFNLGSGTLENSQVLIYLNKGNYPTAAAHMLLYNKSGGVITLGLVNRRRAEVKLFNTL